MYKLLLIKRMIEDVFIYPFILTGKLIALTHPLRKEYGIFFFFPFYHTGGAEKVHSMLANAAGGNDCIIFFTKRSADNRFLNEFRRSGCDIKDVSKFTDNKWLYFLNFFYRGILSGYIDRQQQKPIVFNGQCNFGYKISPWIKKSIPQIELIHSFNTFSQIRIPFLPFISKTIMISRKRIEDHKEQYKRYNIPDSFSERIQYIPNAITLPNHISKKSSDELTILYVGRGSKEKRVEIIAEIAHEFNSSHEQSVKFEILGDVAGTIDKKAHSFIKFYGNRNDENQISEIYEKAHVLILTSTTEGFPMVIMEAMAHGCAILSTPVGDIPYHVKNKENGFLFSEIDDQKKIIDEAKEKITWLKDHRTDLKMIERNNINYAKNNFGIERFNKDYRELFLSIKSKD
ncbi:MAG TPA: glycosyltransferase family 4 protein [Chitinophagaceae bacterium]